MDILSEDEEISIDLGKIKGLFKRKKKKEEADSEVKSEIKSEFKREEGKLGIEVDDAPSKPEREEEKHREIAGVEVEKEDKIFVVEKEESKEDDDEELSFDFSKIKSGFKGIFKGKERKKDIFEEKDDISLDFKGIETFFKKHGKWLVPLVLILIAFSFSTYLRTAPQRLPATDDWAENSVYNYYKSQIAGQIEQQYPNLPASNKNNLVVQEFSKFLETNKEMVKQQIKASSQQFKNEFKDDSGQTYLLAIDPYYWFSEARNYIEYGEFGDSLNEDGERVFALRNGRVGKVTPAIYFHPLISAWFYKLVSIFNKNISLMGALFLMPVIIIGLSLIPAFFLGRKVGGNLGGFFAAMIIAVNSALLGRTPAGFADTDAYNILFPLFIAWLFIESFEAKDWKKTVAFSLVAALLAGLYSAAWGGWWYVFDFVLATIVIYFIYSIIVNIKTITSNLSSIFSIHAIKNSIIVGLSFFFGSMIFVVLFKGFKSFMMFWNGPFGVIALKEVAVAKIWPNVFTTVAEFNVIKLSSIIPQMGGNLLFLFAVLGIVLAVIKKNEDGKRDLKFAIFLIIWFIGTAYGFTKGIRFGILMVPAFAVAFGAGLGIIYDYLSKWLSSGLNISKYISKPVLIIFLCLLLISPINSASITAKNEIPSMNDAWWGSLTKIKDSTEDALITSWWDFGHWFYAVSERRVTFDGADQGERIHWVGKSLLTPNEDISVGLLRMLNCGQEKPVHVLEEFFDGDALRAVEVLNEMMVLNDKEKAIELLGDEDLTSKQIAEIIKITYCDDLIDQFYIASEDMIGKAGVWGHFGSWDFEKAKMYFLVQGEPREKGVNILVEEFDLDKEEAEDKYAEIQGVENADRWVSPWPGYMTGLTSCQKEDNNLSCSINTGSGAVLVEIELETMNVMLGDGKTDPNSIVYATKKGIEEREFKGPTAGFSIVLVPQGDTYKIMLTDPLQAKSMFTQLFFYEGHGLECFDLFDKRRQVTGGMIYVYKVDFECKGTNKNFFLPKEEIRASHILIKLDNRTDEEALELINEISDKITKNNFDELAEEYSEGPTSVKGGDLGWFGKGVMVKEFEDAAFNLKKGEVSEPIKTQFGYHLIKLIDKREIEDDSIPDVKKVVEIEEIEMEENESSISLEEKSEDVENISEGEEDGQNEGSKVFEIDI